MSTELLPGFEPAGVLLSIRPTFANLIANGAKTVELRRRFPHVPSGTVLVVYATQPVAAALGIARLRSLTEAAPSTLWRRFGGAAAVNKQAFDLYFNDCTSGTALELESFATFTPRLSLGELRERWPEFLVPQSYRYVPDRVLQYLIARSTSLVDPAGKSNNRSRRGKAV